MTADLMGNKLQALYQKYQGQYEELNASMAGLTPIEFSDGGVYNHRGAYCPSPTMDIVIGNNSRGKLVRRPRKGKVYDFCYYKDQNGRLVMVDHFYKWEWEAEKVLLEREFILYQEGETNGIKFSFFRGTITCCAVTLCIYDHAGRLTAYRQMDTSSQIENWQDSMITVEDYRYGKDGFLEYVFMGEYLGWSRKNQKRFKSVPDDPMNFSFPYAFRFYHDEEGRLSSYETRKIRDGKEVYEVMRTIPESLRRKV